LDDGRGEKKRGRGKNHERTKNTDNIMMVLLGII